LQLHKLCMALKSGLPECVPWALNALALASFDNRPELQLPSLPGLLPALLEVPPPPFETLSFSSPLSLRLPPLTSPWTGLDFLGAAPSNAVYTDMFTIFFRH
jgi:hypothetical protein